MIFFVESEALGEDGSDSVFTEGKTSLVCGVEGSELEA